MQTKIEKISIFHYPKDIESLLNAISLSNSDQNSLVFVQSKKGLQGP